jgi:hypothetical protein
VITSPATITPFALNMRNGRPLAAVVRVGQGAHVGVSDHRCQGIASTNVTFRRQRREPGATDRTDGAGRCGPVVHADPCRPRILSALPA